MSRDFTPAEMYMTDKTVSKTHGTLRSIKLINLNTKRPIIEMEKDAKNEYPELHFLLDGFVIIYRDHRNDPVGRKILNEIENELKSLEMKLDQGEQPSNKTYPDYNSIKDVTELWFYGKLDVNFYYNTYNNNQFRDFIERIIKNST